MNTDDVIQNILSSYRNVAVVGMSPNSSRPSYQVARFLIDHGYHVVGVRPGVNQILGCPCFKTLQDIPGDIEIVDVFRAPEHVPGIVQDAVVVGARVLWLQEGVVHKAAENQAREAGIAVVSDRCMLKEHVRVFRDPSSMT